MRVLSLLVGIVLTLWTVVAVVHSMLIPSGPGPLIARVIDRSIRVLAYAPLSLIRSYSLQNRWLASMAPISVLMQLVVYVIILIFTFGLIVYGTSELSLLDSLYQSGSTLTTLGIVEPVNVPSAITTFAAAFMGLVVIAIFIGYLLSIYGALVSRESQMARLSILAGEPAWGPQILARAYVFGVPGKDAPRYGDWINWTCDLRLNQQVNPILSYFRSTTELRHWVVSMLAVLDATALRIAFDPGEVDSDAVSLLVEGGVTLAVLNRGSQHEHNWSLQVEIRRAITSTVSARGDAGLSTDDWNLGIGALQAVEYPLPTDLESARQRFLTIRETYVADAYALAQRLHAVPAPWSGPRNPPFDVIWPQIAQTQEAT